MRDLHVLVVGEDPLARGGLAALLSAQELIVAGQAGPDDDRHPVETDVAVWDAGPGDPEFDGLDRLTRAGVPVLVLVSDEAHAAGALAAGATGALLRDTEPERLFAALRALAQGLVVLEPGIARTAVRARTAADLDPLDALTPRELEVLQLLAQGLPNKAIAVRLEIAERTAKFHVNAILAKLGAENRSEAIVRAVRLGLVVL